MKYELRYRYSCRGRNTWLVYCDGKFVKSFANEVEAKAFIAAAI